MPGVGEKKSRFYVCSYMHLLCNCLCMHTICMPGRRKMKIIISAFHRYPLIKTSAFGLSFYAILLAAVILN